MYSSYQRLLKKHNIDKNLRAAQKKDISARICKGGGYSARSAIFLIFSAKLGKKAAKMRYIS